eukprot:2001088-Prymnesium_polylepis.2
MPLFGAQNHAEGLLKLEQEASRGTARGRSTAHVLFELQLRFSWLQVFEGLRDAFQALPRTATTYAQLSADHEVQEQVAAATALNKVVFERHVRCWPRQRAHGANHAESYIGTGVARTTGILLVLPVAAMQV